MDSIKKLWIGLVAVAIIAIFGLFLPIVKSGLGAISPSDAHATNWNEGTFSEGLAVGSTQQFQVSAAGAVTQTAASVLSTLTEGGGLNSTSTSNTAETLVAADIDTENVIFETPNVASLTLTLPTIANSGLTAVGQHRRIMVVDGTTTAAVTITLARNTNTLLQVASTTPANTLVIPPQGFGWLDLILATSTSGMVATWQPVK